MRYARLTIKGKGLKFGVTVNQAVAADIIAYIDKYHHKEMLTRKPKGTE